MENLINSILLIDDDYASNLYNKIIIKKSEIAGEVIDVYSGDQALEFLSDTSKQLPELILLDINMPIMNGWEFLEAIEKFNDIDLSKVAIYMLTASRNPDDKEKAKQYATVSGFFTKPLEISKLKSIAGEILS